MAAHLTGEIQSGSVAPPLRHHSLSILGPGRRLSNRFSCTSREAEAAVVEGDQGGWGMRIMARRLQLLLPRSPANLS